MLRGIGMKYHGWTTIVAAMIVGACSTGNETATDKTWRDRALMDLDFIVVLDVRGNQGGISTN